MSRATRLARLPRFQVLASWHLTFPAASPAVASWAATHATKEQLVEQIVTQEEADPSMDFYDAADWRNIPRGSAAMLYRDGDYAAPVTAPADLDLTAWRWITVTGDYVNCGAIDWEPGNPCYTPMGLASYVAGRKGLGKRGRVYCQRSLLSAALDALADSPTGNLATYPGLLWWIPTLDGRRWTAIDLARDCSQNYNAALPVATLWACQFDQIPQLGPAAVADVSELFGTW